LYAAEKWKIDNAIDGVDDIDLHHLYRAMGWLGERHIQIGSEPLTCRIHKDKADRYIKAARGKHFAVDEEKIQSEEKFDGIWILRTNTDLSAADVARHLKELWMVEDVFPSVQTVLETRPIICGPIFVVRLVRCSKRLALRFLPIGD
jgi:hypothetical protein